MQCRVQQLATNPLKTIKWLPTNQNWNSNRWNGFAGVHFLPDPIPQLVLPVLQHFPPEQLAHAQMDKAVVFAGDLLREFELVGAGGSFKWEKR